MKVDIQWQDEEELFELVVNAIDDCGDLYCIARDEQGSYGERGYIQIKHGGRVFQLELTEIV